MIYELSINTSAFSVDVLGGDDLRIAFNAWRDGAYVSGQRFYVEGWYDDAQRTPKRVCLDPECIIGMVLSNN